MEQVIIVGGGAAGFFAAMNIAEHRPGYRVTIIEKSGKLLSKVKVSGGGRCNVTNARTLPSELVRFYPRGEKKLYGLFKTFGTEDMVAWLKARGVATHTEPDLRIFPSSNSSQAIIDCFLRVSQKHHIQIKTNCGLTGLVQKGSKWGVETTTGTMEADKVILTTGSSPSVWKLLSQLGLVIEDPVPSLFTFNVKDPRIRSLQGISFREAGIKMTGTNLSAEGSLLITHWGFSGPAVLKLSAWGARTLSRLRYHFTIRINFLPAHTQHTLSGLLSQLRETNPKKKVRNHPPEGMPKRFWESICAFCGIDEQRTFSELSGRSINKLAEELTQGVYTVTGKSTFKEEFVTCGGVSLSEVDLRTFECKKLKGLYLGGEVLDIDGLTGGFNFQACWSAGWAISRSV